MQEVFAICNAKDFTEEGILLLRKAGLKSKRNMHTLQDITKLCDVVKSGDKIVVVSIDRFQNIGKFYQCLNYFMSMGIKFESLNERLQFKCHSDLKEKYKELIVNVIKYEQYLMVYLDKYYKYQNTSEFKRQTSMLCLAILKDVFAKDGILSRN